jgi:A/G-specific adenine glycosylase
MLQQTQVASVIPYFERFMARFADVQVLAASSQDDVLEYWAGLGYYSRARNLHKTAQIIATEYGGEFPQQLDDVTALPGIGPSTAGAILAQAFGQRHAILDGNVKRVLSRYHAIEGWSGQATVQQQLWALAEAHTPHERLADYTQAIMDMGATLCKRSKPQCTQCPVMADCKAYQQDRVQTLPSPRPKRARPLRHTNMLVIQNHEGAVLLQKRPPSGIWGGLWGLPELPEGIDVAEYCQQELALQVGAPRAVESIKHGFTHFELTIQPLVLQLLEGGVQPARQIRETTACQWYNPGQDGSMPALPAPLSKLLHGKMADSIFNRVRS